MHLVRRSGLLFDSRFSTGGRSSKDKSTIHFVLHGRYELDDGGALEAPAMWAGGSDAFAHGEAIRCFRTGGHEALVADLSVDTCDAMMSVVVARGATAIPPGLTQAMVALARTTQATRRRDLYAEILEILVSESLVSARILKDVEVNESEETQRLWDALAKLYERQNTGATVDLLSTLARRSPRQVYRDLKQLVARFGFDASFGETVRTMRLRRAALLLSAPELSVHDVAKLVGYGSGDAMARAFRDERLPPPSKVKEELLSLRQAFHD